MKLFLKQVPKITLFFVIFLLNFNYVLAGTYNWGTWSDGVDIVDSADMGHLGTVYLDINTLPTSGYVGLKARSPFSESYWYICINDSGTVKKYLLGCLGETLGTVEVRDTLRINYNSGLADVIINEVLSDSFDYTWEDDAPMTNFQIEPDSGQGEGYVFDNITLTNEESFLIDNSTRIVSLEPDHGEIIATTTRDGVVGATTTIYAKWYINGDDLGIIENIAVKIENIDTNDLYILDKFSESSFTEYIYPETGGYGDVGYEVWLPEEGYKVRLDINTTYFLDFISNPLANVSNEMIATTDGSNLRHQYHLYAVGQNTLISSLRQDIDGQLDAILSSTGTSSIRNCHLLDGDFDAGKCLAVIFIPSQAQLQNSYSILSQHVLTKFPLGYVWDIVHRLNSTTTIAITPISGTIQGTGVADGSSFNLGLTADMFSWFWNATSSKYGSSTETFYEVTYGYWRAFVYICLAIYLLARILGSHVIGIINEDAIQTKRDFKRLIKKQ